MCQQKNSDGASLREEKACPDCLMTKNRPEVGLQRLVDLSTISNGSTSLILFIALLSFTATELPWAMSL